VSDRDHYKDKYGSWAGNNAGSKPDFNKCCEEVWSSDRWSRASQCSKSRGFGPEKAYCKIHDPSYVEEKSRKQKEEYIKKVNKQRYQWHGKEFFLVLETIANGHNDPRSLAMEVIKNFKDGERT
jgi:hypothetical protein